MQCPSTKKPSAWSQEVRSAAEQENIDERTAPCRCEGGGLLLGRRRPPGNEGHGRSWRHGDQGRVTQAARSWPPFAAFRRSRPRSRRVHLLRYHQYEQEGGDD